MKTSICLSGRIWRALTMGPYGTGASVSAYTPRSIVSVKPRFSTGKSPRTFLSTSAPKRDQPRLIKDPQRVLQVSRQKNRLPSQTWDGHMHVVEPQYPIAADAVYQPTPHTFDQAIAFESSLGIKNIVLVQPSVYGNDNSCLLDALRRIGPSRGRGVVVVDPANIQIKTLKAWHSLGVRGVRVNLKSVGKEPTQAELEQVLLEHAEIARPLNWIVQIYMSLDKVPMLERIVPKLGVRICLDHFGGPDLPVGAREEGNSCDPFSLAGFASLISLLRAGKTYVKISAPYRLTKDNDMRYLESMIRVFLQEAPRQVIYGTDWPHTRFSGIDIGPFTELCLRACESKAGLADRVFGLNMEELMDGKRSPH